MIAKGDIDGGLQIFMDALEGPGAWKRLPAAPKQLLRDNATTLIGQTRDQRPPFSKADAEAIKTPTLFIGGANTKGMLPQVLHTLAANVKGSRTEMIPGTTHPMFEQAPQKYCEIVLDFLAERDTMQTFTSTVMTWPISRSAGATPRRWSGAWHARRFSHLECGDGAAVEKASRDRVSLRRFFPEHWDGVGNDYRWRSTWPT